MPDPDPYNALSRPPGQLSGPVRPQYDIFGVGQMEPGGMGAQLAMYAPLMLQQFFGANKFIPQQAPAQNILDQMVSAKYMTQDSVFNREKMRGIDQGQLFQRFQGMREQAGFGRAEGVGAEQLNKFAGFAATDMLQGFAGMMIGPQNVEDLFFGRKGSAVQLANSVNQLGFYRPDSVVGGDRMSGASLQQFTEQLYGNLYGPGANMNDISGFSAGRVGNMATDLAQRGLLPRGIGAMPESQRMEVIRDKSLRPADMQDTIARELAEETFRTQGTRFADYGGRAFDELDKGEQKTLLDDRVTDNRYASQRNAIRGMYQQQTQKKDEEVLADFSDTIKRQDFADSITATNDPVQIKEMREMYQQYTGKSAQEAEAAFADPAERGKVIRDMVERAKPTFQEKAGEVVGAMDDPTKTFEEVTDMAGGASAVRKVDATRVSNKLKEYAGVVESVRAIFGDNGMGNAPMSQLIAALDALSQGGMASMSGGKLENIMRRTQMAARDNGTSLEALMGLSSRAGALADQNGLDRSTVPEAVISAMERGRAMRDTGTFERPGFGKMDANAATLFALDQNVRSDASNASRLASVANRIVKENKGNRAFEGRAQDLMSFVSAMESGQSTFVDSSGNTVNIAKEMGQDPQGFMSRMFDQAGVTDEEVSSRLYDAINTQEYIVPGQMAAAQRYEAIQRSASSFTNDFLHRGLGGNLTEDQRAELAYTVGESFSTAMIDDVETGMAPEKRIEVLKGAMQRGVEKYVRQNNPGKTDAEINTMTKDLLMGQNGIFKDDQDLLRYTGMAQADIGRSFEATTGMNINKFRQVSNLEVFSATEKRTRRNRARAELESTIGMGGDGSNFLQRLSDALVDGGGKAGIIGAALGVIDTQDHQKKLIDAVGGQGVFEGAMEGFANEYSSAVVDTDAEKKAEIARVFADPNNVAGNFADFKSKFDGTGFAAYMAQFDSAISDKALTQNIYNTGANSEQTKVIREIYQQQTKKSNAEVDADFADDAKRKSITADIVKRDDFRGIFERRMEQMVAPDQLAAAMNEIGLGAKVMTESQMREGLDYTRVIAGDTPAARKANSEHIQRLDKMAREMGAGTMSAETILGVMGKDVTADKRADVQKAMENALEKYDDTKTNEKGEKTSGSMTALETALESSGVDAPQREKIIDMVKLARGQRVLGAGLDSFSGENISAKTKQEMRARSLMDAGLSGSTELGALVTAVNTAKTPEAKQAAVVALDEAVKGTDEDFDKTMGRSGIAKSKRDEITKEVSEAAKTAEVADKGAASAAEGPLAGIFAQIGDSIGAAFDKAVAESFKDVKIENVTIAKLNINASDLATSLFNGLKGVVSGDDPKAAADASANAGTKTDIASPEADKAAKSGQKETMVDQLFTVLKNITGITQVPDRAAKQGGTTGPTEFTGRLVVTGMKSAIAEFRPAGMESPADPSAPPVAQSVT